VLEGSVSAIAFPPRPDLITAARWEVGSRPRQAGSQSLGVESFRRQGPGCSLPGSKSCGGGIMRYPRLCTHFPWQVGVIVPLICCFLIALISAAAGAEEVVELWRGGGFNLPFYVSVNPTDGSCWVADGGNDQVVHLSATGAELWRGGGFYLPQSVSVNPTDGSCWVADRFNCQVVHLAASGAELWRGGGFLHPLSVSVNPTDDSCWVAEGDNNQVVHLSATGAELWRGGGFNFPVSVSVNPTDGSCWGGRT